MQSAECRVQNGRTLSPLCTLHSALRNPLRAALLRRRALTPLFFRPESLEDGEAFLLQAGQRDGNGETDALRGEHLAPVLDQLLVGLPDGADVALQVVETERVDVAPVLAQRVVPVDLVGE